MFEINSYHITNKPSPNYAQNVNVYNAPTDKSIELYSEIKEKAYNSIIESISSRDNVINFDGIIYQDCSSFAYICAGIFKINNKDFKFKLDVTDYREDRLKVLDAIYKELSEELSKQFIMSVVKDINEIFRKL